jgi:hypothetical protein
MKLINWSLFKHLIFSYKMRLLFLLILSVLSYSCGDSPSDAASSAKNSDKQFNYEETSDYVSPNNAELGNDTNDVSAQPSAIPNYEEASESALPNTELGASNDDVSSQYSVVSNGGKSFVCYFTNSELSMDNISEGYLSVDESVDESNFDETFDNNIPSNNEVYSQNFDNNNNRNSNNRNYTPINNNANSAPRNISNNGSLHKLDKSTVEQLVDAISKGNIKDLEDLLSQIDINAKDNDGKTPLHHAVINNTNCRKEVFDALLNNPNIDVNIADNNGHTALHCAVNCRDSENYIEKVKMLLDYKCFDINAVDNDGDTPLHIAADKDDGEMFEVLENAGANSNIKNRLKNTPKFLKWQRESLRLLRSPSSSELKSDVDVQSSSELSEVNKGTYLEKFFSSAKNTLVSLTNNILSPNNEKK